MPPRQCVGEAGGCGERPNVGFRRDEPGCVKGSSVNSHVCEIMKWEVRWGWGESICTLLTGWVVSWLVTCWFCYFFCFFWRGERGLEFQVFTGFNLFSAHHLYRQNPRLKFCTATCPWWMDGSSHVSSLIFLFSIRYHFLWRNHIIKSFHFFLFHSKGNTNTNTNSKRIDY